MYDQKHLSDDLCLSNPRQENTLFVHFIFYILQLNI